MLALPSIVLAVAILLFSSMALLVSYEQRTQKRVVLSRVRGWCDRVLDAFALGIKRVIKTINISIAFVVHHIRHAIAAAIAPKPRRRKAKDRLQYQKTNNHLSSMHDHKADTALTETQKKKLRNKKLEESL